MTALLYGLSDGALYCPPAFDAVEDHVGRDAKHLRPDPDRLSETIQRQVDGRGAVVALRSWGRPSAIVRLVVAVVVFAVELMLGRGSLAHVGEEIDKAAAPAVAHRDPSSAVSMILRVFGPVASLLNALPNVELRRVGHAVRFHPLVPCNRGVPLGAAAGLRVPGAQRLADDVGDFAAIAQTLPKESPALLAEESDCREAVIALSGSINECWHVPNIGTQRLNYKR